MATDRQKIETALNKGNGVLRLVPCWVPRSFCIPGKRLKLHPNDYYAFGGHRGGIDERWFASTTKADNGPETLPDEGLSYIEAGNGAPAKVLFKDAIELSGNELLGPEVMKKFGGWVMYSKFFDNQEPLPFHVHQTDERAADKRRLRLPVWGLPLDGYSGGGKTSAPAEERHGHPAPRSHRPSAAHARHHL